MRQRLAAEWLDEDHGTEAEIAGSLDDLWWIQRRLGGLSSLGRLLGRWLAASPPPGRRLRALDVGAGAGQTSAWVRDWIAERGIAAEMFVLDRSRRHLRHGRPRDRGLCAVNGDALAMPFAEASFDLVMCSLFLHHFHGARAEALLRELRRLARGAVLIHDLERSALALVAFRLLSPWTTNRITQHDGAASVRQAYSPNELAALAERAGWPRAEVSRLWPFRLGLMS